MSGAQETFEALSHFFILFGGIMKEYKNNEELIDYLISKNVIVNDKKLALKNIEKYSYYSIIRGVHSTHIPAINSPITLVYIIFFNI